MQPASARPGCAAHTRHPAHTPTRHGRVSMAAFVGFIVQSNGVHWPFPLTPGFEYTAVTPPEQWDAMPFEGKCQIIAFVGFLEWWSEFGGPHYMKGGRPGDFPDFKDIPLHKIPSLYDPAGLSKNVSTCIHMHTRPAKPSLFVCVRPPSLYGPTPRPGVAAPVVTLVPCTCDPPEGAPRDV